MRYVIWWHEGEVKRNNRWWNIEVREIGGRELVVEVSRKVGG
jgi:hypothetical protein